MRMPARLDRRRASVGLVCRRRVTHRPGRHRQHELVQPPHERGRIVELPALREQRLVEEHAGEIVEPLAPGIALQPFDQRVRAG